MDTSIYANIGAAPDLLVFVRVATDEQAPEEAVGDGVLNNTHLLVCVGDVTFTSWANALTLQGCILHCTGCPPMLNRHAECRV